MEESTLLILSAIIYCCLTFDTRAQSSEEFYGLDQEGVLIELGSESYEPIDSGPAVEDDYPDTMGSLQKNRKRELVDERMSNETKLLMLQLHNMYRNNVTPPAANMFLLEWDTELESLAQDWADKCDFNHMTKAKYSKGLYNQNLYLGQDPSGKHSVWMWYEEYLNYDFHNMTCIDDKKCLHYVSMAGGVSKRIGCARKRCGFRYLIVCHYSPPAVKSEQVFMVGRPCSQCSLLETGTKCFKNLCIARDQCERNPDICSKAECNLKCRNCGLLNKTECRCKCADGWDFADCSRPCMNADKICGTNIVPNKFSCIKYNVAKVKLCRKMCETCHTYNENITTHHICCDGKICPYGYVLDTARNGCNCILDCPGPVCDTMDESEFGDSSIHYSGVFSMKASGVSTTNNPMFPVLSFLFLHFYIQIYNK